MSVLHTDEDVWVAVVADAGAAVAAASTPRVEVECGTYGDYLRTEARWRRNS